jgi:hypothetical protein
VILLEKYSIRCQPPCPSPQDLAVVSGLDFEPDGIFAPFGHRLIVRAAFDNPSLRQNATVIGQPYRGKAMADEQGLAAGEDFPERLENLIFGSASSSKGRPGGAGPESA